VCGGSGSSERDVGLEAQQGARMEEAARSAVTSGAVTADVLLQVERLRTDLDDAQRSARQMVEKTEEQAALATQLHRVEERCLRLRETSSELLGEFRLRCQALGREECASQALLCDRTLFGCAVERRALYAWIQELSGAENVLLPEELLRQAQRAEVVATPRERENEQLRLYVRLLSSAGMLVSVGFRRLWS